MAIRHVECHVVDCDLCGQPMDDFTEINGIPHFASEFEVQAFLGGITAEGRILAGTGATGGVLLPDGRFFCYVCKHLPHKHVTGLLIDDVCGRCGELSAGHADADPATTVARAAPARPAWGLTSNRSYCATSCADRHQFAEQGIPEPADGSRIEFGFETDLYAARRNNEQAVLAGAPAGMCWTVYPDSVGHTWGCLQQTFGPCLRGAILLAPAGVVHCVDE